MKMYFYLLLFLLCVTKSHAQEIVANGDTLTVIFRVAGITNCFDQALIISNRNDTLNAKFVIYKVNSSKVSRYDSFEDSLFSFYKQNKDNYIIQKEWIMDDLDIKYTLGMLEEIRTYRYPKYPMYASTAPMYYAIISKYENYLLHILKAYPQVREVFEIKYPLGYVRYKDGVLEVITGSISD